MIGIVCPRCGSSLELRNDAVLLGRHMPDGDGSMTVPCRRCGSLTSLYLTFEDVMHAVFAGVKPIDVEQRQSPTRSQPNETHRKEGP